MRNRIVLHVDFDYFYAQCEEIRNPQLKGKPVVVCIFSDRGGDSGAVATANYTARKFGVKSGIPISFAKSRLHENLESFFLPADFDYYSDVSSYAMNIMQKVYPRRMFLLHQLFLNFECIIQLLYLSVQFLQNFLMFLFLGS